MRLFLTGWICALALITSSPAKTNGETQKKAILFADHNRTFYVFTPGDLATPAPLLLLLHGSGRNGMSLIGPWRALAQKEGLILVAPDSNDPLHWDYQKDAPDFLQAVLTQVESDHVVDTQRVYLFGHSAGSMYALLLAIAESEYFAAIAIHAGSLAEDNFKLIPTAKRRIPISIWAGTNDSLFPPAVVIATRNAFKNAGFHAELHEMAGHDHDYYRVADTVNKEAWLFLKTNRLATSPNFVTLEQFMNPIVRKDSQASQTEAKPSAELKLEPPKLFAPAEWDSAKPYIDYSLPQLTASVPELKGLVATPDQQLLAELVKKTSNKSLDLLTKMPNVISREDVTIEFGSRHLTAHQHFEYLVLRYEGDGAVTLDEYRTDKSKNEAAPLSHGSANAWVLFHPGNLAESRFRYLGRQHIDGHNTMVLAFAQIPEKVKFPGHVEFEGAAIPVLFQGIAWIDDTDFRIVRLRSDLLAPRPEIYLNRLTSEVSFSEVHIRAPEAVEPLWLPHEVTITWNFRGQVVKQRHQYSGFHLYQNHNVKAYGATPSCQKRKLNSSTASPISCVVDLPPECPAFNS